RADASYMTDPKPRPAAARTSSVLVAWSRCSATGTLAEPAIAAQAPPSGSSAPWEATQFWLTCRTTGAPPGTAPGRATDLGGSGRRRWGPPPRPARRSRPSAPLASAALAAVHLDPGQRLGVVSMAELSRDRRGSRGGAERDRVPQPLLPR